MTDLKQNTIEILTDVIAGQKKTIEELHAKARHHEQEANNFRFLYQGAFSKQKELEDQVSNLKMNVADTSVLVRNIKSLEDRLADCAQQKNPQEMPTHKMNAELAKENANLIQELGYKKIVIKNQSEANDWQVKRIEELTKERDALKADIVERRKNAYPIVQVMELEKTIAEMRETHTMQLAAISTAAGSNLRCSVNEPLNCHPDYRTTALEDVVCAVKREIEHREAREGLEKSLGVSQNEVAQLRTILKIDTNRVAEQCEQISELRKEKEHFQKLAADFKAKSFACGAYKEGRQNGYAEAMAKVQEFVLKSRE